MPAQADWTLPKGIIPRKRGQWSRWGRGSCEGYSLEIGFAFRASVVRRDHPHPQPPTWKVSLNSTDLGEYPDREAGFRRAEEMIEADMKTVAEDWEAYLRAKGKL